MIEIEIFLVHGEPAAQAALCKQLAARGFSHVTSPSLGERIELSSVHGGDTVNS
jgi:hypothetical protein